MTFCSCVDRVKVEECCYYCCKIATGLLAGDVRGVPTERQRQYVGVDLGAAAESDGWRAVTADSLERLGSPPLDGELVAHARWELSPEALRHLDGGGWRSADSLSPWADAELDDSERRRAGMVAEPLRTQGPRQEVGA